MWAAGLLFLWNYTVCGICFLSVPTNTHTHTQTSRDAGRLYYNAITQQKACSNSLKCLKFSHHMEVKTAGYPPGMHLALPLKISTQIIPLRPAFCLLEVSFSLPVFPKGAEPL